MPFRFFDLPDGFERDVDRIIENLRLSEEGDGPAAAEYLRRALAQACALLRRFDFEALRKDIEETHGPFFDFESADAPFRYFEKYFGDERALTWFLRELEDSIFSSFHLKESTREYLIQLLKRIWELRKRDIITPCPDMLATSLSHLGAGICDTAKDFQRTQAKAEARSKLLKFCGLVTVVLNIGYAAATVDPSALGASVAIGTVVINSDKLKPGK